MKGRFLSYIKNNRTKLIKIASIVLLIGVMVWLTLQIWPFINSLRNEASRAAFQKEITEKGVWGWFTFFGIQVLQVVVALIPGEPIELLAGVIYGTFGGLLTCLAGVLLGTVIVFYGVRLLGYSFVNAFVEGEKLSKLNFLKNTKRLELITFILFFIPGTPKDVLTYFAGLTPIKPLRFFIISTLARIPSVITSTIVGDRLSEGRILESVIIFAVTAAVAAIGIVVYNLIVKRMNERDGQKEEAAVLDTAEEAAVPDTQETNPGEDAAGIKEEPALEEKTGVKNEEPGKTEP
jgi:uncharacterized membrane protein YdjX (TVP38/TMEM64 family)